jgi:ubiquinone/menaquinone biosynthesis C-methylase UbiE
MPSDSTVSCYDSHSHKYDMYQKAVVPQYQAMLEMVAITCHRYLGEKREKSRILDLGCGTGNASMTILEKIPGQIFLVDGSEKMIDIASEKISSKFTYAVAGKKVADLSSSDWDVDLGSPEYDAIVSTLVLEHLPFDRYRAVLDKCYRLLAPGGWLIAVEGYEEEEGSDMQSWFNQQMENNRRVLDPSMASFVALLREQKEIHYYTGKRQKEDWWKQAGFEKVVVLWQYLCIALMAGRKPFS